LSACSFSGRLIGSRASTISSKALEPWTLAAVSATVSGTPLRSETRWRFEPGLPRSVGFLPILSPPFLRARPRPVDPIGFAKALEQDPVQASPHPGLLPVAQPPPAGRAGPAALLSGERLPRDAALDDAREGRPVVQAWPTTPRLRRFERQERLDGLPQLVTYQFFSRTGKRSIRSQRFCKELLVR